MSTPDDQDHTSAGYAVVHAGPGEEFMETTTTAANDDQATPQLGAAAIAKLIAAVELHRPTFLDKHAHATDDPAQAKWIRCNACHESVPAAGCATWQTGGLG